MITCSRLILVIIFMLIGNCSFAQLSYPDTGMPVDTPTLFAKGILTDELDNRDFTISPKGDEYFLACNSRVLLPAPFYTW